MEQRIMDYFLRPLPSPTEFFKGVDTNELIRMLFCISLDFASNADAFTALIAYVINRDDVDMPNLIDFMVWVDESKIFENGMKLKLSGSPLNKFKGLALPEQMDVMRNIDWHADPRRKHCWDELADIAGSCPL